ncbi:MAG: hypothetical protein ACTTIX_04160 [Peptoanaerobacter stomatis]
MKIELNTLLVQLLIAIIPILSAFIVRLLNLKASEIKQFTKNTRLNKYIDLAKDIVTKSVIAVNQTYVDKLKEQKIFTEEKQKQAFKLAKDKILSILTEDVKKAILLLYGDLNSFLDAQIEATVKELKSGVK